MIEQRTEAKYLVETLKRAQTQLERSDATLMRSEALIRGARDRIKTSREGIEVYWRNFSPNTMGTL